MVAGLENQVFILTSYPDGTPAQTSLQVRGAGFSDRTASTDRSGIAVVRLTGTGAASKITVEARDNEGNHASVPVELEARAGGDTVLLHTEQALYRAGERSGCSC